MKSILSYDSPLMTMMRGVGNTMLINILFLISCIPVVTIGAAWTALFAAGRALIEDGPCIRAYCKSFFTSLKRATLAWLIFLPCLLLSVVSAVMVWRLRMAGMPLGQMSLVVSVIAIALVLSIVTMTFLFYSRFECTLMQLLKNGVYMTIGYLVRSVIIALVCWLPFIALFLDTDLFVRGFLVCLVLYFGVAGSLSAWLMKGPLNKLVETFCAAEGTAGSGEENG
ncbi:MAG: YesL family protein [Oscillospiraceae bacterium]|nr:YesL family protein [Oscillospiraceae bacterium]